MTRLSTMRKVYGPTDELYRLYGVKRPQTYIICLLYVYDMTHAIGKDLYFAI